MYVRLSRSNWVLECDLLRSRCGPHDVYSELEEFKFGISVPQVWVMCSLIWLICLHSNSVTLVS
jgi:hypothetical protein